VNVQGKTILVTGAGRGIGRSLAVHFAGKGANVALLDTNAKDLEDTQDHCTQLGVVARSYTANAANEDSVVGALDAVTQDFGGLDGLINNAGIVRDAMLVKVKEGKVVSKMTLADWQAVIDVNLTPEQRDRTNDGYVAVYRHVHALLRDEVAIAMQRAA